MIHLPLLHGLIRRRVLVNFRADPEVVQRFLPAPFLPKLHDGHAMVGICLIRLEQIRPAWLPLPWGLASENAAHRVAVSWTAADGSENEGVFIPRRDTDSFISHLAGGRLFPGEHHLARIEVKDAPGRLALTVRSKENTPLISLKAQPASRLPETSCFGSLAESSAFFAAGSLGYSATRECCRFDGIRLETSKWEVGALHVDEVESSFFSDLALFPAGSVEFDHALIMRDIPHSWRSEPDLRQALG